MTDKDELPPEEKRFTAWSASNPDVVDLRGATPYTRTVVLAMVPLLRKRLGLDPDGFTILED